MDHSGRLLKIWVKRAKRGPMDEKPEALLVAGQGIAGNADQKGKRQVTLVQSETFERISRELGTPVNPVVRRANLLVSGIELADSRQRVLQIGSCRLLIWGETRPCERMEEAQAGLRAAMSPDWRAGCYGEVLEGGRIAVGDEVRWETAAHPAKGAASPA